MVEAIYDSDQDIRSQQTKIGPWYQARIQISDLQVNYKCMNPIAMENIQKYENSLTALRQGTLVNQYQTITSYRIDEESEKRVKSINTAWPIMIIVWIILMNICFIKIYRYRQSIKNTENELKEEKLLLEDNHKKVLDLRRLKLWRNEMIM